MGWKQYIVGKMRKERVEVFKQFVTNGMGKREAMLITTVIQGIVVNNFIKQQLRGKL